ncbi:hypothetical protein ACHQM5_028738 [Ranunculus cassubicifolius]
MDKKMKKALNSDTSIDSITDDNLSMIFSNLDHFGLARSICVNKSWRDCIHESTILQKKYEKQKMDYPDLFNATASPRPATLKNLLNDFAMQQHKMSFLNNESVDLEVHSQGGEQCRMKMGRILTGVGVKVLRIWSLEKYEHPEEYYVPDKLTLDDIDFDQDKVVGLLGSHIGIWRRSGKRITKFPSTYDTSTFGVCMRFIDQEAVVGCCDGATCVYDMDKEKCSSIISMHDGSVTCLALTDNRLIFSASSLGSIKLASLSYGEIVSSFETTRLTGVTTLCNKPFSSLLFVGTNSGCMYCWDLRGMKLLWNEQVSPNKIFSVQHMQSDKSSVVVGGSDGVLRIVNQDTGEVVSSYVIGDDPIEDELTGYSIIGRGKGRMIPIDENNLDYIPRTHTPPITSLVVGMQKVITTHKDKAMRVWKFSSM